MELLPDDVVIFHIAHDAKKTNKKINIKYFALLLLWFSPSMSPLRVRNWHIKSELMWCFYCQIAHSDMCNLHGAPQWYHGPPIAHANAARHDHLIVPRSFTNTWAAHWTSICKTNTNIHIRTCFKSFTLQYCVVLLKWHSFSLLVILWNSWVAEIRDWINLDLYLA